ncbi:uncharacterized protein VTP21DRAFT_11089 [Calcarisporiella thermophila]|uniref:uncharacterized protein n=1 Tax=Calcarisporiella thermophila TaxID=911321 RepID=UPI0037444A85
MDGSIRQAGDAFAKRERANEEAWIRQQEAQKIAQLRDQLAKQQPTVPKGGQPSANQPPKQS